MIKVNQAKISTFYNKYKAVLLFNKNLIISGAGGLFASAYISQLYSEFNKNEFANSILALTTEYAVYIPFFPYYFILTTVKNMSTLKQASRMGSK